MISLKGTFVTRALVHLANYYDALIDYPCSEINLNSLMKTLLDNKIVDQSTVGALMMHAEKLKKKLEEEYNS